MADFGFASVDEQQEAYLRKRTAQLRALEPPMFRRMKRQNQYDYMDEAIGIGWKIRITNYYDKFSVDDCVVRKPRNLPTLDEHEKYLLFGVFDVQRRCSTESTYRSHRLIPWKSIPVGRSDWNRLIHRSEYYLAGNAIRAVDAGLIVPLPMTFDLDLKRDRPFSLLDLADVRQIADWRRRQQNDGCLSSSTEPYRRFCSDVRRLLSAFVVVPQICSFIVAYSHAS
jgi:hypothetical protein